MIPSFLYAEPL